MFSDRRATVILTAGLVMSSVLIASGTIAIPEPYRDGEIMRVQNLKRQPVRLPNSNIRLPNRDIVSKDESKSDRYHNSQQEFVRLPNGDIIICSND